MLNNFICLKRPWDVESLYLFQTTQQAITPDPKVPYAAPQIGHSRVRALNRVAEKEYQSQGIFMATTAESCRYIV